MLRHRLPTGRSAFRHVAAAFLYVVALNARADIVRIAWGDAGRFERTVSIASGKMIEVCGRIPAGLHIQWTFSAEGPTEFNIHYHEGKEVIFPAKQSNVSRLAGELRTTSEQDYCWMWSNNGPTTVAVQLALRR